MGRLVHGPYFCCRGAFLMVEQNKRRSSGKTTAQENTAEVSLGILEPAGGPNDKTADRKAYQAEYMRQKRARFKVEGICQRCCKDKVEPGYANCPGCRQKLFLRAGTDQKKASDQDWRYKTRQAVLDHYGRHCACCGESEEAFLAIDHVNEDGAAHRREIPPRTIYHWLSVHGFPPGFQVLCYNCNIGKYRLGRCPHEIARSRWGSNGRTA
jgi:hypothetical protein